MSTIDTVGQTPASPDEGDQLVPVAAGDGAVDEPFIDVPAGLLGTAVELLAVFDELVTLRGTSCVDTQLRAAFAPGTSLSRLRTALHDTGIELADLLDDTGIWVDPTLPEPGHRTYWRIPR